MNFLIFHHFFVSECILFIQFFWLYSPHLNLDILLLLLLWLGFWENWQHQRPLFSQLPPRFCFLSNSCQLFLCETECIILIETNSVFKWKAVWISEGLVEMKETHNFPHIPESYTASSCCKITMPHSGLDMKLRLIWSLRRMVNIKHMNSCSSWKLTVLLWCYKHQSRRRSLQWIIWYMSTTMSPGVWLLTDTFLTKHTIFFTQPSYNSFLFPVQIKFHVDFNCSRYYHHWPTEL